MNKKTIPDMTSPEALENYPAGIKMVSMQGDAWQDVKLSVFSLTAQEESFTMPTVVEPMIVWVISGEAETKERGTAQDEWQISRVQANSLYLTAAGAPYEFSWKRLSDEPFQVMMTILSQPLFEQALSEIYGRKANYAELQDYSGIEDPQLVSLLTILRKEIKQPTHSKLLVQGIGEALSIHLARHYTELTEESRDNKSALPGYKLKQIQEWMKNNLSEDFNLNRLARQVQISDFHFNRLFKQAVGMPPSQYHIKLRLDAAKQLLRETKHSVLEIANEVGYANPSHFARLFRKETGMTPSNYRRQK